MRTGPTSSLENIFEFMAENIALAEKNNDKNINYDVMAKSFMNLLNRIDRGNLQWVKASAEDIKSLTVKTITKDNKQMKLQSSFNLDNIQKEDFKMRLVNTVGEQKAEEIALFIDMVLQSHGTELINYRSETSDKDIQSMTDKIQDRISDLLPKNKNQKLLAQAKLLKDMGFDPGLAKAKSLEVPSDLILEFRSLKKQIFNSLDELEHRNGSSLRIQEIQAAKKNITAVVLASEESKILRGNNPDEIRRVVDNVVKRFDAGLNNLDKIMSQKPDLFHQKGLSLAIGVREKIIKSELGKLASQETRQNLEAKVSLHSKTIEERKPESLKPLNRTRSP